MRKKDGAFLCQTVFESNKRCTFLGYILYEGAEL